MHRPKANKIRSAERCYWCGEVTPLPSRTVEHLVLASDPLSDVPKGERAAVRDRHLVMACRPCNFARGSASLADHLRTLPPPRRMLVRADLYRRGLVSLLDPQH